MKHLALRTALGLLIAAAAAAQTINNPHIRIDNFGYRPLAKKIAILREPLVGFDAPNAYTPGAVIEVRDAATNAVRFSGPAVAWSGGATHVQSGDRVWWFDFSALQTPGTYYVIDPAQSVSSESFRIDRDVYDDVLVQALRMFYYQRCGMPKAVPFAEADWADGTCHHGAQQDLDCRSVSNTSASTSRDLSGGWHDAGDFNKYINFADEVIHMLLSAYERRPEGFGDQNGIPESQNGTPDILDEVKWELDWFLKMQNPDGGVLHKVSVTGFQAGSPASTDTAARRYAPATASATISACGAFAHAARVYKARPEPALVAYGQQLEQAAINAWNWLVANPAAISQSYSNTGFQNVAAEDSAYDKTMNRIRAAIHLFALTGQATYRGFVDANYATAHLIQWQYVLVYEHDYHEALLLYTTLPGATTAVATAIRNAYAGSASSGSHLGKWTTNVDAYRASLESQDYTWGSNSTKSRQGLLLATMNWYGLDPVNGRNYLAAAEDYVHYLHGQNPLGIAYLTNMGAHGAAGSANEMYHAWFGDGSPWDNAQTSSFGPPPGFLTGGVNIYFAPDPAYTGPVLAPPMNQPTQKCYRDWNAGWPEASWQITEPQMAYQGFYVALLAEFSSGEPAPLSLSVTGLTSPGTATVTLGGVTPGNAAAVLWSLDRGDFAASTPIWCVHLGVSIGTDPFAQIVNLGYPSPTGLLTSTHQVPPGLTGLVVHFQGTESGFCPDPVQSGVRRAAIP